MMLLGEPYPSEFFPIIETFNDLVTKCKLTYQLARGPNTSRQNAQCLSLLREQVVALISAIGDSDDCVQGCHKELARAESKRGQQAIVIGTISEQNALTAVLSYAVWLVREMWEVVEPWGSLSLTLAEFRPELLTPKNYPAIQERFRDVPEPDFDSLRIHFHSELVLWEHEQKSSSADSGQGANLNGRADAQTDARRKKRGFTLRTQDHCKAFANFYRANKTFKSAAVLADEFVASKSLRMKGGSLLRTCRLLGYRFRT